MRAPRATELDRRSALRSRRPLSLEVARWVVTLAAIAYLVRSVSLEQIRTGFGQMNWTDAALAISAFAVTLPIAAYRWRSLMQAFGALRPPSPLATFRLTLIATFYNMVLPGGVGGDVVRGAATRDAFAGGGTASLTTVLVDRAMGLAGLLVLVSAMTLAHPMQGEPPVWLRLAGVAALLGMVVLLAFLSGLNRLRPHLPETLRRVLEPVPAPRNPARFVGALVLSLGTHTLLALGGHALLSSMAPSVRVVDSLAFIPLASATAYLPFTVSGMGVRETAFVALFRTVGVDEGTALAASLSIYLCQLALMVLGGVVALRAPGQTPAASKQAVAD